ncbi:MAG: hypothetical protein R3C16_14055 [Hyphomonadaceae bacterium]
MRIAAAFVLAVVLAACASSPPRTAAVCAPTEAEAAWLDASVSAWRLARRDVLKVDDAATAPTMVFFNTRCVFRGEGAASWTGEPHGGQITLPDGEQMPAQITSFASSYDDDTRVYFAMALPEIWEAGGIRSQQLGLERLMTAVMLHEMTHTRQFDDYIPRIIAASQTYGFGDDLTDDIVQDTMQGDADYVAAYEAERDLLFQAAAAPSDAEARALARQAWERIEARRARFFVGNNAKLSDLDDVFLTMEGMGQWVGYAWLVHPEGARLAPDVALAGMRRGAEKWSQDEGLALFLVIDRLLPDWQARAFADDPASARQLLELAVRD